jgi:Fe-S-cluster-containing dehydrogenase component
MHPPLDQDKKPACVAACERVQAQALVVGNLNDPDSEICTLIRNHPVKRLLEELGTEPKVFYLGL